MSRARLTLTAVLLALLGLTYLHAAYLHPILWGHGSSTALDASIGIFVLLVCWIVTAAYLLVMDFANPPRKGRL